MNRKPYLLGLRSRPLGRTGYLFFFPGYPTYNDISFTRPHRAVDRVVDQHPPASFPMRSTRKPPEVLVHDGLETCPYLPNRLARLPMRYPLRRLSPREMDERLAGGERRQGCLLYRTACPGCQSCQPLRVPVAEFQPNRSQRRAWRKGQGVFRVETGEPQVDGRRIELYNLHKLGRKLSRHESCIDAEAYFAFLVESCCETIEFRYFLHDELVGVAVADVGEMSLSAVYCYFDPALEKLSPGVFSVMTQIETCRNWGLTWLYLGFFIAGPTKMAYKATYRPHEVLIAGRWQRPEDFAVEEEQ